MARRQSEAVPIVRHENEFGMHDVPRYRNTKDTKVPRCKESGETLLLTLLGRHAYPTPPGPPPAGLTNKSLLKKC